MKNWKLLLPIPCLAALAMVPQDPTQQGNEDPAVKDITQIVRMSELQYVDSTGKTSVVPSRNVLEIRLLDDVTDSIRLEIIYENGDYSMVDAQAFHLLRGGRELMDVRIVRSKSARLRFGALR